MKKCMILFTLLIGCLWIKAQSVVPQVNENVELMSILSRMAGFQEYNMDMGGQYIKDMDNYFKDNTTVQRNLPIESTDHHRSFSSDVLV